MALTNRQLSKLSEASRDLPVQVNCLKKIPDLDLKSLFDWLIIKSDSKCKNALIEQMCQLTCTLSLDQLDCCNRVKYEGFAQLGEEATLLRTGFLTCPDKRTIWTIWGP